MNLFYILGSIGGIIVLIDGGLQLIKWIGIKHKKYMKYKTFYERNHRDDDIKLPMGFRTEKEQAEIEARVARKG